MSICDNEENRRKLAWLVPGYILLAWFFCILFQPLGIYKPPLIDDRRVDYLHDTARLCQETSSIVYGLGPGRYSNIIFKLGRPSFFLTTSFNCSVDVQLADGLDGIAMVIEEMNLSEHEKDEQAEGSGRTSACRDYIEVWSSNSKEHNRYCGSWGNDPVVNRHRPYPRMVEFKCPAGKPCSSPLSFYMTVSVNYDMGIGHSLSHRGQKGFTVTFTGFRKADRKPKAAKPPRDSDLGFRNVLTQFSSDIDGEGAAGSNDEADSAVDEDVPRPPDHQYQCDGDEFMCSGGHPTSASNVPQPTCIWKGLKCDSHLNCGFVFDSDESGCAVDSLGRMTLNQWSLSTIALLVVIYVVIVVILVTATMLILRCNRALGPLDVLTRSSHAEAITTGGASRVEFGVGYNGQVTVSAINPEAITNGVNGGADDVDLGPSAAAGSSRIRTPAVSITVMYRAQNPKPSPTAECPPSYESLCLPENPPNYSLVTTVNVQDKDCVSDQPSNEGSSGTVPETAPEELNNEARRDEEHCQCPCDHTSCSNAKIT